MHDAVFMAYQLPIPIFFCEFFLPITLAKKVKYLRAEVDDKKLLRQKLFKTIIATFIFD